MTHKEIMARRRRVALSVEEIALLATCLNQLTVSFAVDLRKKLVDIFEEEQDPAHRATVDAYRAAVQTKDGEMELDGDAEVSLGDDPGAYVMVWKWVSARDAGVCLTCGETNADNGEGYEGLCGSCADKSENEEEKNDAE